MSSNKKHKPKNILSRSKSEKGIAWLSCPIHAIEYDTSKGCPACARK